LASGKSAALVAVKTLPPVAGLWPGMALTVVPPGALSAGEGASAKSHSAAAARPMVVLNTSRISREFMAVTVSPCWPDGKGGAAKQGLFNEGSGG
jgi:hypothetical protein